MRTEIVHSLAGVRAALDGMGRPGAGRVRVLRGQTREYKDAAGEPLLLPSLSRRSGAPMYDPAWLGAMMSFVAVGGDTGLASDFVTFQVWAPALVQHYGPGSHYLDVSHDLEVALWFATHDYIERWFMVEGNPRKQLPDLQHAVAWSSEVDPAVARTDDGGPVIYVFDVEPWDGKGAPRHGQLVDLLALEPIRHLGDYAARIKAQSGALLFSDPGAAAEESSLRSKVARRIYLGAGFDLKEVADLKWVGDIYPAPGADPLYKALLELPGYLQFDPLRLEQPLAIPFQLTRELPLGGSPNVSDGGGKGTYACPKRLKFSARSAPDLHVVTQVQDYLSLGRHMEPPLLHAWLLENGGDLREVELSGTRFRLEDALPLFLESPLWAFMPGVSSPRDLGMWIQSALPHGIADTIGGRSTASAYVELCPLDIFRPGQPANQDLMRAMWVVRDALDYAVTVFRKGEALYSFCVRYRYDPESGSFQRQGLRGVHGADATLEGLLASALKALFLTLTVLRDLSPGYKPPPSFSLIVGDKYLPMPLLEPQLANPSQAPASPYVVPKALDGSRYLRASGGPRETPPIPEDLAQARHWLEHFLALVKAPEYRAFAAKELARLNLKGG